MTVPVGGLRLSYVVPAWNEADGITTTLDALANSASQLAADGVIATAEFVVVDDGSTDGTPELLAQRSVADARLTVVTHDRNRGLGAAIRSGLAAATGDVVVYTDADLPFDLAEVRTGLDTMQRTDADIVSLYRYSRSGEGARRYVFSLVYNALVRWGLGLRVRDVNFAGKLLRRAVLDAVDLHSEGSFIDAELLARAQRAGFRITQFGVNYFPRSRGVSTLSSTPVVLNILREFLRLRPAIRAAGPSLSGSAHTDGVGAGGHRRRVLDAYAQHPVATRAHVRGRWRTAPLASLDRWVPPAGRILEFGTGNGVVAVSLALQSPDRSVLAVDIDERRTGSAAAAVARMRLADRVDVLHVGDDWVPSPNSFDAVVVVDVLYLFGRARALEVLDALLAALRPNGVLVVKEMADSPRWKGRVNRFQEWVAVRGLGVTSGNVVDVIPAEDLAAHLRRRGCTVEVVALDSGYAHPHAVVVAHP